MTERLRAISPEDPLRYDFALCHDDIFPVMAGWSAGR